MMTKVQHASATPTKSFTCTEEVFQIFTRHLKASGIYLEENGQGTRWPKILFSSLVTTSLLLQSLRYWWGTQRSITLDNYLASFVAFALAQYHALFLNFAYVFTISRTYKKLGSSFQKFEARFGLSAEGRKMAGRTRICSRFIVFCAIWYIVATPLGIYSVPTLKLLLVPFENFSGPTLLGVAVSFAVASSVGLFQVMIFSNLYFILTYILWREFQRIAKSLLRFTDPEIGEQQGEVDDGVSSEKCGTLPISNPGRKDERLSTEKGGSKSLFLNCGTLPISDTGCKDDRISSERDCNGVDSGVFLAVLNPERKDNRMSSERDDTKAPFERRVFLPVSEPRRKVDRMFSETDGNGAPVGSRVFPGQKVDPMFSEREDMNALSDSGVSRQETDSGCKDVIHLPPGEDLRSILYQQKLKRDENKYTNYQQALEEFVVPVNPMGLIDLDEYSGNDSERAMQNGHKAPTSLVNIHGRLNQDSESKEPCTISASKNSQGTISEDELTSVVRTRITDETKQGRTIGHDLTTDGGHFEIETNKPPRTTTNRGQITDEELEHVAAHHSAVCKLVSDMNSIFQHYLVLFIVFALPSIGFQGVALTDAPTLTARYSALCGMYSLSNLVSCLFILYLPSLVHSAAHDPLDILLDLDTSGLSARGMKVYERFLNKLSLSSIGYNLYGFVLIQKSTLLALTGTLVTYMIVLIQFKPSGTGEKCLQLLEQINTTI